MTTHQNYFEIAADTHYELGLRMGELFGSHMRKSLEEEKQYDEWCDNLEHARSYVGITAMLFPQLIEEVHGYAEGARVCFEEAWALLLEDELSEFAHDKCTTIVTNGGSLIAHNEDWEISEAESICVLRKSVGGVSVLELFYVNSLGGNAISINSHGFVHAVNSVAHKDHQFGVPRNFVARWLSETKNPENDFWTLSRLPRSSGYHHSIVSADKRLWSIECTATRQTVIHPTTPFVHTNHYVTDLSKYESEEGIRGTRTRYRCASENVRERMSLQGIQDLLDDTSEGEKKSIFNNRTIAQMIVDLERMTAYVWLRREDEEGWVAYPIGLASASSLGPRGATPSNTLLK
jgi:hypothetical protein